MLPTYFYDLCFYHNIQKNIEDSHISHENTYIFIERTSAPRNEVIKKSEFWKHVHFTSK